MSNEYHCRPCGRTRTVDNAEPVCPDCVHAIKTKLAAYEQGPDDAEVKKIEDHYKRGQYVCEECVEPCEHTPVFFLLDALRAERAKVARAEKLISVLSKTPYVLSEPNGTETLAAWEEYNARK